MSIEAHPQDDLAPRDGFEQPADVEADQFEDDDLEYSEEVEAYVPYRTLSKGAVFSLMISVISPPILALFVFSEDLFWAFSFLPVLATVLGFVSALRIRRYPLELTGMPAAVAGIFIALPTIVGGGALQAYIYVTEVPEGYERISWYDLKPDREHPELPFAYDAAKLHGKKVFIKGYVHPNVDGAGQVKKFLLVGDMGTCCFGGMPELSDMITVTIVSNDAVKYNQMKRRFGGEFRLDPRRKPKDGSAGGYYELHVDYVK